MSTVPWNIRSGFDLSELIVDFSRALKIVSSVNSVAVLLGLLLSARLSGSYKKNLVKRSMLTKVLLDTTNNGIRLPLKKSVVNNFAI